LLSFEARDALGARADVELKFFAINLDQPGFLLQSLQAGSAFCELRFEMLSLQRQISYLVLDLLDLLLSILKDEELFQFCLHVR
jgi:hypothetical protein